MVLGISLVRNEIDIIEWTIAHQASQLDGIIVADNGSTDGTREVLERYCDVIDDPEPGHFQSRKMSALAEIARTRGAEWVVPFDADERWLPNDRRERIAEQLMRVPDETLICEAAVLDHVATGDPQMPYRRRAQLPLRKVACRAVEGLVIHDGNHGATFPGVEFPLTVTGRLEVRHYPYRSPEQFIRKARQGAAAMAATDLPENVGKHWRDYGRLTDDQLREVFAEHFFEADPESAGLVRDPCPRPLVRA